MTHPAEIPQTNHADFAIRVQWNDGSGSQKVAREGEPLEKVQQQAEIAVNKAMGTINYMAHEVAKTLNGLKDKTRPDEAEVEFGITLDAKAGALLSSAGVGAQLTVKLKWSIEQPERVRVLVKE